MAISEIFGRCIAHALVVNKHCRQVACPRGCFRSGEGSSVEGACFCS